MRKKRNIAKITCFLSKSCQNFVKKWAKNGFFCQKTAKKGGFLSKFLTKNGFFLTKNCKKTAFFDEKQQKKGVFLQKNDKKNIDL